MLQALVYRNELIILALSNFTVHLRRLMRLHIMLYTPGGTVTVGVKCLIWWIRSFYRCYDNEYLLPRFHSYVFPNSRVYDRFVAVLTCEITSSEYYACRGKYLHSAG